jgi:TonB family protein
MCRLASIIVAVLVAVSAWAQSSSPSQPADHRTPEEKLRAQGILPPKATVSADLAQCVEYYPEDELERGISAFMALQFTITKEGTATDVTVAHSSGRVSFDKAAVACISQWKFRPATKDGEAIDVPWTGALLWAPKYALEHRRTHRPRVRDTAKVDACLSVYPPRAREVRAEGTSALKFTIDNSGSVKDIALVKSSGNEDLDAAALKCTALLEYEPAEKDGRPIDAAASRAVEWKLTDTPFRPKVVQRPSCLLLRLLTKYPDDAADRWTTELSFVVEDGKARDFSVTKSSGYDYVDNATIDCVKLWTFTKVLNGKASVPASSSAAITWVRPTPRQ